MRNVIFAINMTADGFFGHEDGIADEELHDYFTGLLRDMDVLLYGRATYHLMVPFWPEVAKNPTDERSMNDFARTFDALEKVVFSKTLKRVEDPHSRLASRGLEEEVRALKQRPGKAIAVGSVSLASQLSALGLIDEYRIVVHPVIAGKGPRMFATVTPQERRRLHLVDSKTFQSGAVALHYRTHS
jgi:dihydrofolate reductase